MKLFFAARAAALLLVFMAPSGANSQSAPANAPLKEVHVGATAFSLANPTPSWVEPTAIPESDKKAPLVVRLADTQYLVAETPIVYVHRALKVDDAASLTAAGQLAISFVPQYQRLNLHAIHVLRGQEVLDRTTSSTLRFLEREMGLESGSTAARSPLRSWSMIYGSVTQSSIPTRSKGRTRYSAASSRTRRFGISRYRRHFGASC